MIQIHDSAQQYFLKLIEQQGIDDLGLRLAVLNAGTPRAECELSFCEPDDAEPGDMTQQCDGFTLYVDGGSAAYLEDAEMEYVTEQTGGQLVVRAPNIKGEAPGSDAPLRDRVQYLLDSEINPMVAQHGGMVGLVDITDEGVVVLQFGGGCHGCGMIDVTLKQGIEKSMKAQIPEVTEIRDATDHSTGENPYY